MAFYDGLNRRRIVFARGSCDNMNFDRRAKLRRKKKKKSDGVGPGAMEVTLGAAMLWRGTVRCSGNCEQSHCQAANFFLEDMGKKMCIIFNNVDNPYL